jgi:hypothetical protein
VWLAVGWLGLFGLQRYNRELGYLEGFRVEDVVYRVLSGFPSLAQSISRLVQWLVGFFGDNLLPTVVVATMLVPLGFAARVVARARVRAGGADPLDGLRRWLTEHRAGSVAVVALLPVVQQALLVRDQWWRWTYPDHPVWVLPVFVALYGYAQLRFARGALRALTAPTLTSKDGAGPQVSPDEIRFSAVAVTRETKGAVAALGLVTLAVATWVATRPDNDLFRDPRVLSVLASYMGVAVVSALAFRRASRVSIGVDGIYVGGSSRPRFYAYRGVDGVRVRGGDIEIVRRDAVVLRLQLHGEDAGRREAIVARIQEALARAKEVERDAAAHFVTSRSPKRVSDAAQGRVDYRMPAVSEDALWALVEGSGVDAATRTAAAEALAHRGKTVDRKRFRVAAAHCAEPKVRVVLEELGAEEHGEAGEGRRAVAQPVR